MKNQIHH